MVIENSVKKYLMITSFIIAIVLFFAGLGLGLAFDKMRTSEIDTLMTKNQIDMESFLLQQQLLSNNLDAATCNLAKTKFIELQAKRAEIGQKLDTYSTKVISQTELDNLKRKHIILSVNSMIMLDSLKTDCGFANLDAILFFYASQDSESTRQGLVLDEVYNRFPDAVVIFAFDANFEQEPLIDFLKAKYNITTTPTVIINDKPKHEGLTSVDEIVKEL
ncbi:MAG: thioredoxin family protein [DPANN group archaeon]|nr:thioredoxin family protein [DPANN group archaeon]